MINTNMKDYIYYTFGELNEYGQAVLSKEAQGTIKMAIYISSQFIQDNINYKGANFVGLTNSPIDDSYVIEYGEEKLKVLYITPGGRYKQVFLARI